MSLLLYCVAPASAAATVVRGVGDAPVRIEGRVGLRFFISEVSAEDTASRDVVTAAKRVHEVISDVFSRGPVLPFRYPTVLADVEELAKLAADRADRFRDYLRRTESKAQIDIRLSLDPEHPPAGSTTGRNYLEGRAVRQAQLSAAAETCRQTAHPADWRFQQRGENLRCQALVERVEVVSFLKRMRTLELPGGVKAVVSGPWPPAGFWEDDPR
jgi:hypothetical protein